MGAPKPTLGYPSRTAAVLAMRSKNLPTAAIAARIGVAAKTVIALERSAERTRALVAEGCRTVLFPAELLDELAPHAAVRDTSAGRLARRIVEVVVQNRLIDAVLDDGAGA